MAWTLSEKLLLAVDSNQERDPQLDNVQRVGDFGVLRFRWDFFFNQIPPLKALYVEEEAEVLKDSRDTASSRHTGLTHS